MKKHQYHRPGTPLMPEICPPVYRTWQQLHTARTQAIAALHIGLALAAGAILTAAAIMALYLSR